MVTKLKHLSILPNFIKLWDTSKSRNSCYEIGQIMYTYTDAIDYGDLPLPTFFCAHCGHLSLPIQREDPGDQESLDLE